MANFCNFWIGPVGLRLWAFACGPSPVGLRLWAFACGPAPVGLRLWGLRLWAFLWAFVIRAPESVIFSLAILLCIAGAYLSTGTLFGVVVLLVFAALGYAMTALGFSTVIFIIAFFLGPRFELSLNQSLTLIDGDPFVMLDHPVAIALLVLAAFTAYWLSRKRRSANDPSR